MNSHHKMIISENVAILLSLFTHVDLIQSCSYHTILIQLAIIPIPFCYVNFTQMFFCTHLLGQIMMTNILGQIKIFAELKSCINYFIYKMIQYLVCVRLLGYYYYCFWRKLQPSQLASSTDLHSLMFSSLATFQVVQHSCLDTSDKTTSRSNNYMVFDSLLKKD